MTALSDPARRARLGALGPAAAAPCAWDRGGAALGALYDRLVKSRISFLMSSMESLKRALRLLLAAFRTVLRGFGLSFIVLALLLAAAAFYAQRRFGPEEARELAIAQLQALLHREVAIERMILTPRGFKIRGLKVRRADPTQGDQLVCDTALVTVRLRPLLRRRLEFDTVRLESPQIDLRREADGSWDIADVFASSATRRGGALPLALASAETIVEDGVLRVDDRRRARKISFERLSLRADGFDQDRAFPLAVSFVNAVTFGTRTLTTSVSAEGSMDLAGLRWSSATARADRFTAEADGVQVSGKGSVAGFARPVFEFDASVPALGPERWPKMLGRDLQLSLPATKWSGRVNWSSPPVWEIERLSIETPAGSVTGTGVFDTTADTAAVRAQFSTRDTVLEKTADWHPSWTARAPRGKGSLHATVEGKVGALQVKDAELILRGFAAGWKDRRVEGVDLDLFAADEFGLVKASVSKGKLFAYGSTFDDLAAAASIAKQTLTVENLSMRWGSRSSSCAGGSTACRRRRRCSSRATSTSSSGRTGTRSSTASSPRCRRARSATRSARAAPGCAPSSTRSRKASPTPPST
ncbi:MAG: AsmA-like C-terminal region-containing protein [Elusimicrobiota bacterium]|nr:MAG: AsmA-like C-terminal region-containing protein [Elusimicrobiota bacterium]